MHGRDDFRLADGERYATEWSERKEAVHTVESVVVTSPDEHGSPHELLIVVYGTDSSQRGPERLHRVLSGRGWRRRPPEVRINPDTTAAGYLRVLSGSFGLLSSYCITDEVFKGVGMRVEAAQTASLVSLSVGVH